MFLHTIFLALVCAATDPWDQIKDTTIWPESDLLSVERLEKIDEIPKVTEKVQPNELKIESSQPEKVKKVLDDILTINGINPTARHHKSQH